MITRTKIKQSGVVDSTGWKSGSSSRNLLRQEDGPSLPQG